MSDVTAELNEVSAYVRNALFELDALESTVIDTLTGGGDYFVKHKLLVRIASIRYNLKRASA